MLKKDYPPIIKIVLIYLASLVDMLIWTPIFTGAIILWSYIALYQYENPMLLWIIIPLWMAMAIPPTRWVCRIQHEQNK